MKRTRARELALHLIFEMGFQPFEEEQLYERLQSEMIQSLHDEGKMYEEQPDEKLTQYICSVVRGTAERQSELDTVIEKCAKGWKLSRLSRMTTAILRLAIYEIRYVDDVPTSVAINEAVELAKTYDTEEASSFINGILGTVARTEPTTASTSDNAV